MIWKFTTNNCITYNMAGPKNPKCIFGCEFVSDLSRFICRNQLSHSHYEKERYSPATSAAAATVFSVATGNGASENQKKCVTPGSQRARYDNNFHSYFFIGAWFSRTQSKSVDFWRKKNWLWVRMNNSWNIVSSSAHNSLSNYLTIVLASFDENVMHKQTNRAADDAYDCVSQFELDSVMASIQISILSRYTIRIWWRSLCDLWIDGIFMNIMNILYSSLYSATIDDNQMPIIVPKTVRMWAAALAGQTQPSKHR